VAPLLQEKVSCPGQQQHPATAAQLNQQQQQQQQQSLALQQRLWVQRILTASLCIQ
jgi:hypothetical protein